MAFPGMPQLPTQGTAGQMRAPINPMMQRQQAPMGMPPMPNIGGGMPTGLPSQAMQRPMMPSMPPRMMGGGMPPQALNGGMQQLPPQAMGGQGGMPQLPPQAMQGMVQNGLFGGNAVPPGMQQALKNPQLLQLLARFGMMGGQQ